MSTTYLLTEHCRTHNENMSSASVHSNLNLTRKHSGTCFKMNKYIPASCFSLRSRNQSLAVVHFLKAAGLYLVNSCYDVAADRCHLNVRLNLHLLWCQSCYNFLALLAACLLTMAVPGLCRLPPAKSSFNSTHGIDRATRRWQCCVHSLSSSTVFMIPFESQQSPPLTCSVEVVCNRLHTRICESMVHAT